MPKFVNDIDPWTILGMFFYILQLPQNKYKIKLTMTPEFCAVFFEYINPPPHVNTE